MTQDQTQSFVGVQKAKRKGRGLQTVLIASALLVLMVLAVGIREYVGVDPAPSPGNIVIGNLPPTTTTEIDEKIWASQGDTVSGKYLASRHAERMSNFGVAADLLLDVLESQPDNSGLAVRAHVLLVSEGRFDEAQELAARVLEDNDTNAFANLTIAMKLVEEEAYEEALSHILAVPHQGANTLLMPMLEAWTFAGMGEADAAYESVAQLNRNNAFDTLKGLHAGVLADMLGDMLRAEEEYALALGDGNDLPLRVAEIYVSFLTRQERWDEAEVFLGKYSEQNPNSLLGGPMVSAMEAREKMPLPVPDVKSGYAEAFYSIANLLNTGQGDIQPLLFVRHALRLLPDDARSLFLLGDILSVQERDAAAIAAFNSIATSSPFSWYARLSVASMLAEQEGRLDEAVSMLEAMVDERPQRFDAARALGDIQRVDENWRAAVVAYDIAVERMGEADEGDWQLFYTRGIALERRSVAKDLDEERKGAAWARAEENFLKALELNPGQPHVLNYLGYSWVEKGVRLSEAREMIERSVSQQPRNGYITDSMGWILYRMEEFEEAVVLLERAAALEPSDPIINDHLGDVYWTVGRKNEARFQWNRALENEPDETLEVDIRAKLAGEKEPQPKPPGEDSDI